jgi:hypothetical protein
MAPQAATSIGPHQHAGVLDGTADNSASIPTVTTPACTPSTVTEPVAPAVSYWHVWTDAEGISHQSRGSVQGLAMNSISAGAAAQWIGPRSQGGMEVLFTVLPPGWQGDWHENPAPQWIVPLSGRWAVETMDGHQVEMGPGEVSFGGDQHTRTADGRRGHRSWTVGDQPAVLLLVQLGPGVPVPEPPKAG